ncbi:uncharacterized protein LOC121929547 isoform X1 [Sceloporus undulatus]|uniref:uncharacterized protein LOC121929547 isoform X1 n=1 Tax=Sceloporus undulatus TaxID=8520 RepID=UPI001C4BC540|nr:uncharacterized protein LOC121929547 isoform X1 [Sceloporus undulatus]
MDTLTASSVPSRPWVLQFFRNLFGGSRQVVQEGQRPKEEAQEKEELGSQFLDCPLGLSDTEAMLPTDQELGATETSPIEIQEGERESHTEELSLLKGRSFRKATPRNKKKLFGLLNSGEMEMGGSHGFTGTMIGQLVEHPCETVPAAGEKNNEPGDRETLGKDEVSQVLHAADGISMAVGSIADVKDCSAEEEKEHLLKEDVQTEAPKTELSPWNRLINMYKQRRRLPAPKSHHQDISAQPLIEGETTLDLMVFGIAASKDHVPLTKPCGAGSAYGVPENEAGEIAGDCEITQRNLGLNDAESLEHPKNVY